MISETRGRRKGRQTADEAAAEGRLHALFVDLVDDEGQGREGICSYLRHIGLDLSLRPPEAWWPSFRAHYAAGKGVDEERVATDMAIWAPIASRVVELVLEQRHLGAATKKQICGNHHG